MRGHEQNLKHLDATVLPGNHFAHILHCPTRHPTQHITIIFLIILSCDIYSPLILMFANYNHQYEQWGKNRIDCNMKIPGHPNESN